MTASPGDPGVPVNPGRADPLEAAAPTGAEPGAGPPASGAGSAPPW